MRRKIIALALAALLFVSVIQPAAADTSGLCFTAINDTLLDLGSLAASVNGTIYVPAKIFSSLGVYSSSFNDTNDTVMYLRKLDDLIFHGVDRISSGELGKQMGLTPSQIRQDFSCFGEFGQQGYGYRVSELREQVARILGMHKGFSVVIVGVGNLGHDGHGSQSGNERQRRRLYRQTHRKPAFRLRQLSPLHPDVL